jgi:Fe-S-cluster-containing dehydrogenase component
METFVKAFDDVTNLEITRLEKCTLCVQRIQQGKIAQKVRAGNSGDVAVRDGAIKTACQSFPSNLIAKRYAFGPAELLQIDNPEERKAVRVAF